MNELYLATLTSSIVSSGICPNFLTTYVMYICPISSKSQLIMEYATEGDLRSNIRNLTVPVQIDIIFQIFMGIYSLNKHLSTLHNDLHLGNILLNRTKEEYLVYRISNSYYKIPTYGYLVKIVDFSRAGNITHGTNHNPYKYDYLGFIHRLLNEVNNDTLRFLEDIYSKLYNSKERSFNGVLSIILSYFKDKKVEESNDKYYHLDIEYKMGNNEEQETEITRQLFTEMKKYSKIYENLIKDAISYTRLIGRLLVRYFSKVSDNKELVKNLKFFEYVLTDKRFALLLTSEKINSYIALYWNLIDLKKTQINEGHQSLMRSISSCIDSMLTSRKDILEAIKEDFKIELQEVHDISS